MTNFDFYRLKELIDELAPFYTVYAEHNSSGNFNSFIYNHLENNKEILSEFSKEFLKELEERDKKYIGKLSFEYIDKDISEEDKKRNVTGYGREINIPLSIHSKEELKYVLSKMYDFILNKCFNDKL